MNSRCSLKDEKYVFKYQGCEPNVCKIPSDFNEKYEFKDPSELRSAGHTVTINDVMSFPNQAIPCQITTPIIKDLSKIQIKWEFL